MSNLINIFVASQQIENEAGRRPFFIVAVKDLNMFVTNFYYDNLEINSIYDKLLYQYSELGKEAFNEIAVPKKAIESLSKFTTGEECLEFLNSQKKKRNVGDAFKHLVTDNWKVDLVMTMNLRSLKNFFNLRDSGAASFQIRWLAEEIKKATPEKYKKLIIKK
jgi:thymidylate synthase (FAD)